MAFLEHVAIPEPSTVLITHQAAGSTTKTNTNTLELLSPALANTFYFYTIIQRLLSTTTIFLLFRIYSVTSLVLEQWHVLLLHSINISRILFLHSIYASKLIVIHSWYASRIIAIHSWYTSRIFLIQSRYASSLIAGLTLWGFWKGWKATEPVRHKLFYEFMVFILGCGNQIILIVFWPGWLFIGAPICGLWFVLG
jgi:hypothetical protein